LVVDNDREIREGLASYLQGKGFETLRTAGGEEALRRLPDFRPHIVLLDISMPGLSGIETLRRIKALPTETSVVMLCRQRDEEAARKALALGAADYLRKPVDVASLDAVLETHLLLGQLNSE
ncbi:MAG: response regulator, partial [candidate division NC10 bacterium]